MPMYINKKGKKVQKQSSHRLRKLTNKRNNKIDHYMHVSTKKIVDYCKQNNINNVVLGRNRGWKQEVNIGKINNQNFVDIPFNKFESYLTYKLQKEGFNIKITEESYTSKCSALDLESLCFHEKYLGERIKRGMFKSSDGTLINADINGSLNILRKEIGDDFILSGIGLVVSPLKVTPL